MCLYRRFPSISFDFRRFPSISVDYLRLPSIAIDYRHLPSTTVSLCPRPCQPYPPLPLPPASSSSSFARSLGLLLVVLRPSHSEHTRNSPGCASTWGAWSWGRVRHSLLTPVGGIMEQRDEGFHPLAWILCGLHGVAAATVSQTFGRKIAPPWLNPPFLNSRQKGPKRASGGLFLQPLFPGDALFLAGAFFHTQ